jgi:hypothetical protein
MKLRAATAVLFACAPLHAAERPDLLRFTNGDQLHGAFLGIEAGPQAVWKRDDLAEPVRFKTSGVRHIVLRGGQPAKGLATLSHIGLANGDRIPGTVTAMDAESLTIDSEWAGTLRVPRNQVAMLAPNPLGGRIHYHGPFSDDGWRMAHPAFPKGLPEAKKEDATKDDEAPGRWEFSGAAWYWKGDHTGTALIRPDGMTDRSVLRFELAWKNRLNLAVAFHADLEVPPPPADGERKEAARAPANGDNSAFPMMFGNSYVLQMFSSYFILYRAGIDDEGNGTMERVRLNNSNLRLGETGRASVEIRSNRRSGLISLFINDEFVSQWAEGAAGAREDAEFAGKGAGFGFVIQGEESPVRISDIVVSEWNGMPDSARSLEVEDQDVVLMANGTDRFAGKLTGMEGEGRLAFEGRHGRFSFPLSDVAEIRFARSGLAAVADAPSENIAVRLHPFGLISGSPVSGDASAIALAHPVLGSVRLSTASAVMIEFNSSNHIIDDWDADF